MQGSLSVLLPVKDAQATLMDSVHEILDEVADAKSPFELIIIDDGSSDATSEVADELVRHYPQVRLVRHRTPLGHDAAIRTGYERSQGDLIVMRDERGGFRAVERHIRTTRSTTSRPARPNYLGRIKNLALGE